MKFISYLSLWFLGFTLLSIIIVLVDRIEPNSGKFLNPLLSCSWTLYLLTKYDLDKK